MAPIVELESQLGLWQCKDGSASIPQSDVERGTKTLSIDTQRTLPKKKPNPMSIETPGWLRKRDPTSAEFQRWSDLPCAVCACRYVKSCKDQPSRELEPAAVLHTKAFLWKVDRLRPLSFEISCEKG